MATCCTVLHVATFVFSNNPVVLATHLFHAEQSGSATMSGARGVAEAQWTAHLNSAVANAFRQMLDEKPPDPVARIGRLLTATVDGSARDSM